MAIKKAKEQKTDLSNLKHFIKSIKKPLSTGMFLNSNELSLIHFFQDVIEKLDKIDVSVLEGDLFIKNQNGDITHVLSLENRCLLSYEEYIEDWIDINDKISVESNEPALKQEEVEIKSIIVSKKHESFHKEFEKRITTELLSANIESPLPPTGHIDDINLINNTLNNTDSTVLKPGPDALSKDEIDF